MFVGSKCLLFEMGHVVGVPKCSPVFSREVEQVLGVPCQQVPATPPPPAATLTKEAARV